MSSELAVVSPLSDKVEYARALAPADLLPPAFRGKPANVLLAMEAGESLGRSGIEIMQNAQVINGKLSFSAEFQRALVLESGHKIRVFMDGDAAVAQGVRKDDPEFTYEVRWTADRARQAKLGGDNWSKYPAAMLKARATTELCRDAFADVIRGYRSAEELRDEPVVTVTQAHPGDALRAAVGLAPIHDAEIVDESGPVDTEGVPIEPDPITPAQLTKLHILFKENDLADRQDALDWASDVVGRELKTSKDLSKIEATDLIEKMTK